MRSEEFGIASIATQLTQALGSGKLAGDELKSIAENSPVLIQATAREFGVAVGALKDMGAAGELSSARVFKTIMNAGREVDEAIARTTPTIASGIQQVYNALTERSHFRSMSIATSSRDRTRPRCRDSGDAGCTLTFVLALVAVHVSAFACTLSRAKAVQPIGLLRRG